MSLFIFLTVVQAIIAAALVGVVLMQRSEGGGLGVGGRPSGMMTPSFQITAVLSWTDPLMPATTPRSLMSAGEVT